MYNLLLYTGFTFIALGFIGFIVSVIMERKYEIEIFRQEQLTKSFNKQVLAKEIDRLND